MGHLDSTSAIVIASAFGDAAQAVIAAANPFQDTIQKVIDLIDGAKVGIVTIGPAHGQVPFSGRNTSPSE